MIAPGRSKPGKGLQKDLHDAIRLCSYNDLRRAIQNGADVNSGDYLDKSDFYPLLQACADSKGLWIVRLLIEHGARVDVRNTSEATPLHIACFNGRVDSVRTLIDTGADVGAIDIDGLTPFDDICKSRADVFDETYAEIGDILISNGADIDSFNLHHACLNIQVNLAQFLLSRGADPNIRDHLDKTPLDIAVDLPQDIPEREEILDLFREFHPELYFSKFCTMDMRP